MDQEQPNDIRELAGQLVQTLIEIQGEIIDAREQGSDNNDSIPSVTVQAYMLDTQSLMKGIRDGAILTGQPRMASNLVAAVQELEATGHEELTNGVKALLGVLSDRGLAADQCNLARGTFRERA